MTPVFLGECWGQVGLVEERKGSYKLPGGNPPLRSGLRKIPSTDVVAGILLHFLGLRPLTGKSFEELGKKVQTPNNADTAGVGAVPAVSRPKERVDGSLTLLRPLRPGLTPFFLRKLHCPRLSFSLGILT